MTEVTIVKRDGGELTVKARNGLSLMETIRDNGVDELLALCGGCCSCATCHVYVDEGFTEIVGAAEADEDDLLDSSSYRQANSRLSCQIKISEQLNGLRVTIVPEE